MNSLSIEVILHNVEKNPHCFHGPTLLFKKRTGKTRTYYACSACRDHKECNFYLPATEKNCKVQTFENGKKRQIEAISLINKLKPYKKFLKIISSINRNSEFLSEKTGNDNYKKIKNNSKGHYCYTCHYLFENNEAKNHINCKVLLNLTYHQLMHPTEILIPKTDNKTHAQYFFSKSTIADIKLMLERLKVSKIICIGVPTIHEFILNDHDNKIKSLLLDLDKNYYNFYSKYKFIWFNMFNSYIFDEEQQRILIKFLKKGKIVVLMDPPFGGRVEPLARTLNIIIDTFKNVRDKEIFIQIFAWLLRPVEKLEHFISEAKPKIDY